MRTTGIFCRPSCPARRPRPENVRFYATPRPALRHGYRPCRRCHPLEADDQAPEWLRPLLAAVERDPARRWRDIDLRTGGLLSPERVRRWFQNHHGMSFHAYSRARRLGAALERVQKGSGVTRAAFESGYDSLSGFQQVSQRLFGDSPARLQDAVLVHVDRLVTPLGPILAGATDTHLCMLEFVDRRALPVQVDRLRRGLGAAFVPGRSGLIDQVEAELGAYFAGDLRAFSVPLRQPGTDFQRAVRDALTRIPYGTTCSYTELAAAVGRPRAVRAAGTANGRNALAVVVPCHRVVGAAGGLGGYAGGLWRKHRLLELEGAVPRAGG